MGYNFGYVIASGTIFNSRGWVFGVKLSDEVIADYEVLRNIVIHGNHFLAFYIWGAHWRHLANTTEPSVCGSDAALCQITLTTCFMIKLLRQPARPGNSNRKIQIINWFKLQHFSHWFDYMKIRFTAIWLGMKKIWVRNRTKCTVPGISMGMSKQYISVTRCRA